MLICGIQKGFGYNSEKFCSTGYYCKEIFGLLVYIILLHSKLFR